MREMSCRRRHLPRTRLQVRTLSVATALAVFGTLVALGAGAESTHAAPPVPPPPPTLTGEGFFAGQGALVDIGGTVDLSGSSCTPNGTSTIVYSASGLSLGPYQGTFAESGTITVGPQTTAIGVGDDAGPVETLSATFTIDSALGQVQGSKHLVSPAPISQDAFGFCRSSPGGYFYEAFASPLAYEAQITTASGVFSDQGTSSLGIAGVPGVSTPGSRHFDESFVSDLTETVPLCDKFKAGKNGKPDKCKQKNP